MEVGSGFNILYRFSVMGLTGALMIATDETAEIELRKRSTPSLSALMPRGRAIENFANIISSEIMRMFENTSTLLVSDCVTKCRSQ